MSSRLLTDLTPEVGEKAKRILEVLESVGVELLIYCTLRTLEEQAVLFRQSRSWGEIQIKITKLRNRGFGFLADILNRVGPCYGPHVTYAAPGESWHNYSEAFDSVPMLGGKPVWRYSKAPEHWDAYGESVRCVGLQWAGEWPNFKEKPHAQLQSGSNPLRVFSSDKIKEILTKNKLI